MELPPPSKKTTFILLLLHVSISSLFTLSSSFNPKSPPKLVRNVCHRSGSQMYWYCISVFNTGSVTDTVTMQDLSYYTRDFAETNVTDTITRINSTILPNQRDEYVQQVVTVCRDAFTQVKDVLNRVTPMIVEKGEFEEAKPWVNYGMGLVSTCGDVCKAKPRSVCPLTKNVHDTHGMLKLLSIVLELSTEGVN